MDKKKPLPLLNEGDSGMVNELLSSGSMRRRLQDLGIIKGTKIYCLQKSPYGDPTAYFIRGAVIALRKEDAMSIIVS